MKIEEIKTDNAPAAIGPYSQALIAGGFLFVSGQIPLNPKTGAVVDGGIREQTKQVLVNLETIVAAAGSSVGSVVKVEIYLKNMNDFSVVNGLYSAMFTGVVKPARQVVEAARLPKDVLIEMSCIALAE